MNNGPEFDCECAAQVFQREIKMILINGENKKKMILTRVVLIKFKNLTITWAVQKKEKIIDSMLRQN